MLQLLKDDPMAKNNLPEKVKLALFPLFTNPDFLASLRRTEAGKEKCCEPAIGRALQMGGVEFLEKEITNDSAISDDEKATLLADLREHLTQCRKCREREEARLSFTKGLQFYAKRNRLWLRELLSEATSNAIRKHSG